MTGGGNTNGVTGVSPRIWKAAEMAAEEVLREVLLGSETFRYVPVCALISIVIDSPCYCYFTPSSHAPWYGTSASQPTLPPKCVWTETPAR